MANYSLEVLSEYQKSPVYASVHYNPSDDTKEDELGWFSVYLTLPLEIRMGMVHEETEMAIDGICRKYGVVDLKNVGEVSRIVRDVFVKGIKEQEIVNRLATVIKLPQEKIRLFINDLKAVILKVKDLGQKEYDRVFEKIPVKEVLRKHPLMGEDTISDEPIHLKGFAETVQPSIKNWIQDYIQTKGAHQHDSLERSDYLYNSHNTKKLSEKDRYKVSYILDSYDNGSPVLIDREVGAVYFSNTPVKSRRELGSPASPAGVGSPSPRTDGPKPVGGSPSTAVPPTNRNVAPAYKSSPSAPTGQPRRLANDSGQPARSGNPSGTNIHPSNAPAYSPVKVVEPDQKTPETSPQFEKAFREPAQPGRLANDSGQPVKTFQFVAPRPAYLVDKQRFPERKAEERKEPEAPQQKSFAPVPPRKPQNANAKPNVLDLSDYM